MKKRIIALIVALFSFSTLLVGCGEVDPCETHVDANKDAICDGCKRAIITIVTELPYEEDVVEMVVKTPAADAKLEDFVITAPTPAPVFMGTDVKECTEKGEVEEVLGNLVYIVNEEVDDTKDPLEVTVTYEVYDFVNDKVLFKKADTFTEDELDEIDECEISLFDHFFVVAVLSVKGDLTVTYYNNAGVKICEADEMDFHTVEEGGLVYFYASDKAVVLDAETNAVLYTAKANLLVKRPEFDWTTENYGVCLTGEKLLVYDLSKWIDCVYAYSLPSSHEMVGYFPLAEDKMLIQSYEPLRPDALNFDIEVDGYKYDIRYTVLDFAAKTATEQEFGYVIESVTVNPEGMTENAKNLATVAEITNKKQDDNAKHQFVIDEKLDILFAYEPLQIAQQNYELTPVAEGLFLISMQYADNTVVRAVINAEGEIVAYVPRNSEELLDMLLIEGALYDYTLTVVLDLAKEGYTIESQFEAYVILSKETGNEEDGFETEYYFYNGATAPKKIKGVIEDYTNDYLVVSDTVEEEVSYTVYNAAFAKVKTFDESVSVTDLNGEGVFAISVTDATYIVR